MKPPQVEGARTCEAGKEDCEEEVLLSENVIRRVQPIIPCINPEGSLCLLALFLRPQQGQERFGAMAGFVRKIESVQVGNCGIEGKQGSPKFGFGGTISLYPFLYPRSFTMVHNGDKWISIRRERRLAVPSTR